jgi:hypothetical protein
MSTGYDSLWQIRTENALGTKQRSYERMFAPVSETNMVYPTTFLTDLLAEQTSTMDKEFTAIKGEKLPDNFFTSFLERQGLRLEGAEGIKSLRGKASDGETGLDKARLEELYEGLKNGDVRFVLRSEGEELE